MQQQLNRLIPDKELTLISDAEVMHAKNSAIANIQELFGRVRDALKGTEGLTDIVQITGSGEVDTLSGRIFRGENYRGLPWVVLDYPRMFSKTSVFTYRTMFWWGHFFSCTLHIQGKALEACRESLAKRIGDLATYDAYTCVGDTPWEYHYGKDNYRQITDMDQKELLQVTANKDFIKLSRKLDLSLWEELESFASDFLRATLAASA